jgi:uncharacterized protein with ParB-like and HNH nuclease domain
MSAEGGHLGWRSGSLDTILKNIPMPKIFISKTIKGDTPYLSVIDGQQRITAILSFMRDEFNSKNFCFIKKGGDC